MRHIGSLLLVLTGLRLFFDAAMEIKMGSLRGLYDTQFSMLAGLASTWLLGVHLSYLFGIYLGHGLIGFAVAGIIAMVFGACAIYWRWVIKSRAFVNL